MTEALAETTNARAQQRTLRAALIPCDCTHYRCGARIDILSGSRLIEPSAIGRWLRQLGHSSGQSDATGPADSKPEAGAVAADCQELNSVAAPFAEAHFEAAVGDL